MAILCIGADYRNCDLEFRGRLAYTENRYNEVYALMNKMENIDGCIIVATCNRVEYYVSGSEADKCKSAVEHVLSDCFSLSSEERQRFYSFDGEKAIEHIFRVASGLESMVIGEDQILSQVKNAQTRAIGKKASDVVLNRLFREAITCAKSIKHSLGISENKLSVASIAMELLERSMGSLEGKKAMLVGTGEMSVTAAKYLKEKDIGEIILANRNLEKAEAFLSEIPGTRRVEYENRFKYINEVDIIISATSAPHIVFDFKGFKDVYEGNGLYLVDMAVPRDMDADIGKLQGIKLFDMDSLREIAEKNREYRSELVKEAEQNISWSIGSFMEWLENMKVYELLSRVDSYIETSVVPQAEGLLHKLECPESIQRDEALSYGLKLSGRMLRNMILKLKGMPSDKGKAYANMLSELLR